MGGIRTVNTHLFLAVLKSLFPDVPGRHGCSAGARLRLSLSIALLFPFFTTQAAPPKAQLFEGLGNHNRTITTNSAKAQEFFNGDDETLQKLAPGIDRWWCSVCEVQKRFGHWDDILAEPAPPACLPITTATWRAARAVAFAAKNDVVNAECEYRAFKHAEACVPDDYPWGRDAALKVLRVSDRFILGEIALQQDNWDEAANYLEEAAKLEGELSYGEPPHWLQPVRHTLGAVYLKSHKFVEAERAYREDLAVRKAEVLGLPGQQSPQYQPFPIAPSEPRTRSLRFYLTSSSFT